MSSSMEGALAAALAVAWAGCAAAAPPAAAYGPSADDPAPAGATLIVRATVRGNLPRMRTIDFKGCVKAASWNPAPVADPTVVQSDGRLANVVAWVSRAAERRAAAPPGEEASLEIVRSMFVPHVLTLQTGQTLRVSNRGPCLQNPCVTPKSNPEINQTIRDGGPPLRWTFPVEEVGIAVRDEVHGWMRAWIGVFSHPFHAVTAPDGTARIRVPPGDYEVSAWHEYKRFAKSEPRKVAVAAGETKEIEFVFEAK